MFAGIAIFYILTWRTRKFDVNFVSENFYFLLNQGKVLKDINTVCYGLELTLCDEGEIPVWIC